MTTIVHGQSFTLSGFGSIFGTKPASSPTVYDDMTGTDPLTLWDGFWPNFDDPVVHTQYNINYRAAQRGIAMPNSRTSKYLCGCHYTNGGADAGYNVMFWKNRTISFPSYAYWSYYQRIDDAWDFGLGSPADDNFKTFDYSFGSEPFNLPNNWYIEYNPRPTSSVSSCQWHIVDDIVTPPFNLQDPDQNGHGWFWGAGINPAGGAWIKVEIEVRYDDTSSGYIRMWENNVLDINYQDTTDGMTGTSRCEALGGYARSQGSTNNWRYFGGPILYDRDPKRIVLTNNATYASSTIVEPQSYSAWSVSSVTAVCNGGSLSNGTVYAWLVEGFNGTSNPITSLGSFDLADSGGGPSSIQMLRPASVF